MGGVRDENAAALRDSVATVRELAAPTVYTLSRADEQLGVDRARLNRRWGSALTFLIPALQFIQFHIVGILYATDLLSLAVLLLCGASSIRGLNRRSPRTFLIFGIVWLMAQGATDFIRATPFQDYARGWAMIIFTLVNFAALYTLISEYHRRIIFCALGFAVGGLLTFFLNPNAFAAAVPWKFGFGYPITLLAVLAAVRLNERRSLRLAFVITAAAAAINLYEGFRSLAGECFLAATYLVLMSRNRRRSNRPTQASPGLTLVACAALGLSVAALLRIYGYCASNGLLGDAARQKYEMDDSGNYGLLVGGRPDFFTGLEAALDSPIIGHGSWAKDWRYASSQGALLTDLGYRDTGGSLGSWLIPSHSYLIGAWVDAGIVGALFWLWVLSLPLRVLARLSATDEPFAPLIAFLATGLIWDVLFSPFGAAQRFSVSFAAVTLMCFLENHPLYSESALSYQPQLDEVLDRYNIV